MRYSAIFIAAFLLYFGDCHNDKPTVDENGTISLTICDGALAELSCPTGKVISIVIGNYGRFSTQVCIDDDNVLESSKIDCKNDKTKSILEKKCNGKTTCDIEVSKKTFIDDPCPATSKYLEVYYNCVVDATTTTTTTTTTGATSTYGHIVVDDDDAEVDEVEKDMLIAKQNLYCEETRKRGVKWPRTMAGKTSVIACPEATNGKQSWECSSDGFWATEFPNTSGCESEWVSVRSSTLNDVITSEDGSGIPEVLRKLVSDTRRPTVGGDLPKTLHFLEQIVAVLVDDPWTKNIQSMANKGVVEVLNYLVRNNEVWPSWDIQKRKEFAARIIALAEKTMVASALQMPNIESNVIVQPAITCEISHKIKMSAQPTDYMLFPSSALWGNQNVDNVNIPREAITSVAIDDTQIYFTSVDNIGSQMTPRDIIIPSPIANEKAIIRKRKVVSRIVGASLILNGEVKKVEKLKHPIRITFYHKESTVRHMKAPTCVWWNMHQLDWSPMGCRMSSHNLSMTVCECDHLTHFAVLMDVYGHDIDEIDESILTILTYIGCGISIVCLLITFFAYLIFSRNGGDRVFIHENLCLTLAIAEITFLAGISRTEDSIQCGWIAAALMYLFLSALTWMLLEGYHIYRMLTEVFESDPRRIIYLAIGYFTPAIITMSAWFYDSDGFGTSQQCWLSTDNQLIMFFVGPASVILLVNMFVLLKTLCIVYQHSNGGYLPCRHDVDSGRTIRSWVKGGMALSCLLGVTWSVGLLWIDDEKAIVVAYIFTIANSLQGLFIFLFHVVFSDKMRSDISNWMRRRGCGSGSSMSSPQKRGRDVMSPGNGSSTGSEFLYPSTENYLTTSDTMNRLPYSTRMPHPNSIPPHLKQQLYEQQHPHTYDYATIAYGDMLPNHTTRLAAPPAYQRLAYVQQQQAAARYASQSQLYQGWHHRPPPEFSPPPPPSANPKQYGTGSSGRRPPSSKMSDDSAYSDGGSSSMLTTEVTPQGQTVLRIDLNKPNMYCQEL